MSSFRKILGLSVVLVPGTNMAVALGSGSSPGYLLPVCYTAVPSETPFQKCPPKARQSPWSWFMERLVPSIL